MKGLTDIPGILAGHASDYDGLTGCTVVLCEKGAVAGGDIRDSATGVDEWDVLSPMHVTPASGVRQARSSMTSVWVRKADAPSIGGLPGLAK